MSTARKQAVLAACLLTATLPSLAQLEDLSWMAGSWIERKAGVETEEHWLPPKAGLMLATNRMVASGKRPFFEFLRIEARDGKPVFLAMPAGRPATEFPMAEHGPQRIVFENPANEFPRRILYWREGEALLGRIEGTRRGQPASEQWRFERHK